MKFDLDLAWREAMGLLRANLGLLATIAGVFYFFPYAATTGLIPEMALLANPSAGATPEATMAIIEATFAKYWWLFLALMILGGIGNLAMLALMRQRDKPTVGEALGTGLRSIASYLAAQFIQAGLLILVIVLLVGLPAAAGARAVAVLGSLAALVVAIYIVIKLSLLAPIIAIEGQMNPAVAVRRSWQLTKGSSLRLFLFFALLIVAFIVVSSVVSLAATLLLAFAGPETAQFGMAVVGAATNTVAVVVGACVVAAIHTQLKRLRDDGPAQADG